METKVEMHKPAIEIVDVLAKHSIPLILIDDVFEVVKEMTKSQVVQPASKPTE